MRQLMKSSDSSFSWAFYVILLLALGTATIAGAQEKWVERDSLFVPPGRDDHMMAFDAERGWVLMFGGDNAGSATWVWDGEGWRDLGIEGPPVTRESAMAYDSVRKVIVMFGGYDFYANSNATYEFDGEQWVGYALESAPVGRSDHAMAFDEERGVMIMFGGEGVDVNTWAYNGDSWYLVNPEENTPGERSGHQMVYDSERRVIVLFGGSLGETLFNDTWEWDGEQWIDVTPAEGSPPAMRDFAMAYDSLRKKTVIFGGRAGTLDGFDSTWEWDGTAWAEVNTAARPSQRHECAAAYDSIRNRMVLFGGSTGNTEENRYKSDTWWYPNNPPDIVHEPVLGIMPNKSLPVRTAIFDYDGDAFEAYVYYRDSGETEFQRAQMEQTSTNTFAALIPPDQFSDQGVEYYIATFDELGSGRWGYLGDADSPNVVAISETGSVSIFIKPLNARQKGASWRPLGMKEWIKSGKTLRGLKPGDLTIQFKSISQNIWRKPEDMVVKVIPGRKIEYIAEYERRDQEQ